LVIPPAEVQQNDGAPADDDAVAALFGRITESGDLGRRDAIREVADRLGLSPKQAYAAIERVKTSVK
jgi:predicted transcriptional regulator YheO